MSIDNQIERLERIAPITAVPPCRCCGKKLGILDGINQAVRDGIGIHTRCIPKHWSKHDKGINAGRCKDLAWFVAFYRQVTGQTNHTYVH